MAATLGKGPRARNARALALAIAAGVVHGLLFAPVGVWPLGFVALVPLLVAVRGRGGGAALALGWVAGTCAASVAVLPWLAAAARDFFSLAPLRAVALAFAATQLFGAVPIALFAWAAARLGRLRSAPERIVAIAAAWTATELARTILFTGMPWDLLGHAVIGLPALAQVADVGGIFAVSFVLAACNAALADGVGAPLATASRRLAAAALPVAIALAYGALRLGACAAPAATLSVALVQANVPNAWRNDPTRAADALDAFARLTRAVLPAQPDLLVWPETAIGVLLASNPRFQQAIAATLRDGTTPLLLGAPRAVASGPGRVESFNSAMLLAPDGRIVGTYDKRHLVPLAEYTPLRHVAGAPWRLAGAVDYTAGERSAVLPGPVPLGVLVCFEAIYPSLARDAVRDGAEVLVNLSNDAWFTTAAGREQHFVAAVFRAIELRRPLVRVANAGITAVVDACGHVERFPTDVAGAWTVAVSPSDVRTPYARVGDLFAWLATALAIVGLARVR